MLKQRLPTGALLIAGLLGLLWLDSELSAQLQAKGVMLPWWFGGNRSAVLTVVCVITLAPILAAELARLLRGTGIAAPTWLTVLAAMAGTMMVRALSNVDNARQAAALAATVPFAVLFLSLLVHARHRAILGVVAATGGTLLAFVYIGVLLGVWLLVRDVVGVWVLAGAMLTIKSSDTGAYFTGRAIGKHKMIPWLSPGKTWEGLVGGIVFAAVVGALLANWSTSLPDAADHVSVLIGALGGAVLGVISPVGDLVESLLKRSAGAKDSGTLLPGMGGALDVLDSPLFAGPVVYWLLAARTF